MSTVDDIENAIPELAVFRAWFAEYDARLLDEQVASDAIAGKLHVLGEE